MRAQPVVAEDDIRVAVHVELHERRLLVEAAEQQLLQRGVARLAQRAVRLPRGGRVPCRRGTPARNRELRYQLAAQKAVRRAGVQEALDPPSPSRSDEPAVDPRQLGAWSCCAVARARCAASTSNCHTSSSSVPGSVAPGGGEGGPEHEVGGVTCGGGQQGGARRSGGKAQGRGRRQMGSRRGGRDTLGVGAKGYAAEEGIGGRGREGWGGGSGASPRDAGHARGVTVRTCRESTGPAGRGRVARVLRVQGAGAGIDGGAGKALEAQALGAPPLRLDGVAGAGAGVLGCSRTLRGPARPEVHGGLLRPRRWPPPLPGCGSVLGLRQRPPHPTWSWSPR